ncbi:MAG: glutaredoxin [Cellulomonas sp. 73-92]|nr:MAG: glutaredoxin [Cellulomonas sp. 73-92]
MVSSTSPGTVRITLVPAPACHFCEDADEALTELASSFAFEVDRVPAETPEGLRLIAAHRPALNPLVLVDGAYFSAGRLPRKKLIKLLTDRGARLTAVGPDGR